APFSVGFDRAGSDGLDCARRVAPTVGPPPRALPVPPALYLDGVRDLTRQLDEPAADPAIVPTFLLSRLAREDVKTVLVGEGGDELLAGYPTYLAAGVAARFRRLPAVLRPGLAGAGGTTGASGGNTPIGYLVRR